MKPGDPPASAAPGTVSGRWRVRMLAGAFLAMAGGSAWLAVALLRARCEGFACTYLGIAWMFWLGVCWLPAAVLGYFAQKASTAFSARVRSAWRYLWLAHGLFALGLLGWWLVHRP